MEPSPPTDPAPPPDLGLVIPMDPFLDIEMDVRMGRLRVRDARLFGPSQRPLCRRLVEALCAHHGVRRAGIDCEAFTCCIDFDLASNAPAVMARVFQESLGAASAGRERRWPWARGQRWSTLVAYRHHGDVSSWEVHTDARGRHRLVHRDSPAARVIGPDALAGLDLVERCAVARWPRRLTVDLRPCDRPALGRSMDRLESFLENRTAEPPRGAEAGLDGPAPGLGAGWRRAMSVALAGGSLCLAVLGLLLPGVPTVPFLLATSYYLARSSPRLNDLLRRAPLLGPVLREWEGRRALSWTSKARLIGLSASIIVATLLLSPLTPVAVVVIVLFACLSIYGVLRAPTLAASGREDAGAAIGVRPALGAG